MNVFTLVCNVMSTVNSKIPNSGHFELGPRVGQVRMFKAVAYRVNQIPATLFDFHTAVLSKRQRPFGIRHFVCCGYAEEGTVVGIL